MKQKAIERINKPLINFRMICERTCSTHMFKAFNITDARNQARIHFNGPVNSGGVIME